MSKVISYSPVKTECNVPVENNDEYSMNNLEENNYVEEDYTYIDRSLYNSYDIVHDFESLVHQCNICDNYETLNEASLASHLAICQGTDQYNENNLQIKRKLYVCDICNKQFTNSTNISRHKRKHTGNKEYECKICLKRFFRKDHLSVHFIKIHRKSFHCTICNIGFQQQELIIAHIQNVHDSQFVMNKSCPLCKFSSNSVINLRIHIFNRHDIDPINSNIPDIDFDVINSTSTSHIKIDSNSGNFNNSENCNDSKESMRENRSESNATPPMHFLTPYVEISMVDSTAIKSSSASFLQKNFNNTGSEKYVTKDIVSQYNERPYFPQPSCDMSFFPKLTENNQHIYEISTITPYASSAPLKQDQKEETSGQNDSINNHNRGTEYDHFQSTSSFSTLINTSPLETLVHNELKQCDNIINISNSFQVQQNNTYSNQWSNIIHKNSLQCSFCDIIFPDQKLYSIHNMCHSKSNPWKCNFCGQQCSNVYEFNSHLLTKDHQ